MGRPILELSFDVERHTGRLLILFTSVLDLPHTKLVLITNVVMIAFNETCGMKSAVPTESRTPDEWLANPYAI